VTEVKADGAVLADMDEDFFSVSDITILDIKASEARRLKKKERITYTGHISHCRFDGTSLLLHISGGQLVDD
jgi:hypothetical protein